LLFSPLSALPYAPDALQATIGWKGSLRSAMICRKNISIAVV